MIKQVIIEYDDEDILEVNAIDAIKALEWSWIKSVK